MMTCPQTYSNSQSFPRQNGPNDTQNEICTNRQLDELIADSNGP